MSSFCGAISGLSTVTTTRSSLSTMIQLCRLGTFLYALSEVQADFSLSLHIWHHHLRKSQSYKKRKERKARKGKKFTPDENEPKWENGVFLNSDWSRLNHEQKRKAFQSFQTLTLQGFRHQQHWCSLLNILGEPALNLGEPLKLTCNARHSYFPHLSFITDKYFGKKFKIKKKIPVLIKRKAPWSISKE